MADKILHQADVEAVFATQLGVADDDYVHKGTTVVATPTAPGVAYAQAEMASLKTAIDAIRAVLIASGITSAT